MRLFALAIIGALLTACTTDSPLATAPEAPLLNATTFTIPSTYEGPACTDVVVLVGETKVVFSVTAASSGNFFVRTQANSKWNGTGTLGLYQGSQNTTDEQYVQRGGTFTFVDHVNIRGQDNPNHFIMHTVLRFRLDETGTPSDPTVDQTYVKCPEETVGT